MRNVESVVSRCQQAGVERDTRSLQSALRRASTALRTCVRAAIFPVDKWVRLGLGGYQSKCAAMVWTSSGVEGSKVAAAQQQPGSDTDALQRYRQASAGV